MSNYFLWIFYYICIFTNNNSFNSRGFLFDRKNLRRFFFLFNYWIFFFYRSRGFFLNSFRNFFSNLFFNNFYCFFRNYFWRFFSGFKLNNFFFFYRSRDFFFNSLFLVRYRFFSIEINFPKSFRSFKLNLSFYNFSRSFNSLLPFFKLALRSQTNILLLFSFLFTNFFRSYFFTFVCLKLFKHHLVFFIRNFRGRSRLHFVTFRA